MSLPRVVTGLPVPEAAGRGRPARYPFGQMTIGSSFSIKPQRGESLEQLAARIRSASATWRQRKGVDCTFRVRIDNDAREVHCWMQERGFF